MKGCGQKGPRIRGPSITASSARVGKTPGTNSTAPGVAMSSVEPKATVLSSFLAARYTQERWLRLKGSSSRSRA